MIVVMMTTRTTTTTTTTRRGGEGMRASVQACERACVRGGGGGGMGRTRGMRNMMIVRRGRKRHTFTCDTFRLHLLWSPRGAHFGRLGTVLEPHKASLIWEYERRVFGFFGSPEVLLEPSWAVVAASWAVLKPSWAVLRPSWAILAVLVASLGRLRSRLGRLGRFVER